MPVWFAVALAGGLGATARYGVSLGLTAWLGPGLPYGTFLANVLGSFLLGALMVAGEGHEVAGVDLRLALGTGLLGGFTTYSSFNYETLRMLQSEAYLRAFGYAGLTALLCLGAGAAGIALGRAIR